MRAQILRLKLYSLALFAAIPSALISSTGLAATSQSLAYKPIDPDNNPKPTICSCAWEPYRDKPYIPTTKSIKPTKPIKLPHIKYCPHSFPTKPGNPNLRLHCPR